MNWFNDYLDNATKDFYKQYFKKWLWLIIQYIYMNFVKMKKSGIEYIMINILCEHRINILKTILSESLRMNVLTQALIDEPDFFFTIM